MSRDPFGRRYPRYWPQVLVASTIVVPINVFVVDDLLLRLLLPVAVGFTVTIIRWRWWRWRNPITPDLVMRHLLEERPQVLLGAAAQINDMREKAKWN